MPLLSAKNRKLKLRWAESHQNWTDEDYENTAWSDESMFFSAVPCSESSGTPLECVERETHSMKVLLKNLQELLDAIMSTWTRISKEFFHHLVKSMPRRTEAVVRAVLSISTVFLIECSVSVCMSLYNSSQYREFS